MYRFVEISSLAKFHQKHFLGRLIVEKNPDQLDGIFVFYVSTTVDVQRERLLHDCRLISDGLLVHVVLEDLDCHQIFGQLSFVDLE